MKTTSARLALAACVACVAAMPAPCAAQELAPRAYFPAPVSTNVVNLSYGFSTGDVIFDPTIPITDTTGTVHAPVASYYYAFGILGRSANVTGAFPFAFGHMQGKVGGQDREIHRAGMGDTVVRLAVNLRGGRAKTAAEFVKTPLPRAVLGASVKFVLPTGQYKNTQLINLGSNRWAAKPEIGFMFKKGLVYEAYAGVWLFSANSDFFASDPNAKGGRRTQDPIGSFEAHVSYDLRPQLWISGDFTYWRGGKTSLNDVESALTLQSNSRIGVTLWTRLSRRHSIKVSYGDGLVIRVGGKAKVLAAGWQYGWVGRPFRPGG